MTRNLLSFNYSRITTLCLMIGAFALITGTMSSCKAKKEVLTTRSIDTGESAEATNTDDMEVVFKADAGVRIMGGTGLSGDSPLVIVGAESSSDGVAVEYKYLAEEYGVRGTDWSFNGQSLQYIGGKPYDVINITTKKPKETFDVYFDISGFFGKW